jgi:hypothetical protein
MQIRPQNAAAGMARGVEHMVVIVPVDADVEEAEHITKKDGQQRLEGAKVNSVGHF